MIMRILINIGYSYRMLVLLEILKRDFVEQIHLIGI